MSRRNNRKSTTSVLASESIANNSNSSNSSRSARLTVQSESKSQSQSSSARSTSTTTSKGGRKGRQSTITVTESPTRRVHFSSIQPTVLDAAADPDPDADADADTDTEGSISDSDGGSVDSSIDPGFNINSTEDSDSSNSDQLLQEQAQAQQSNRRSNNNNISKNRQSSSTIINSSNNRTSLLGYNFYNSTPSPSQSRRNNSKTPTSIDAEADARVYRQDICENHDIYSMSNANGDSESDHHHHHHHNNDSDSSIARSIASARSLLNQLSTVNKDERNQFNSNNNNQRLNNTNDNTTTPPNGLWVFLILGLLMLLFIFTTPAILDSILNNNKPAAVLDNTELIKSGLITEEHLNSIIRSVSNTVQTSNKQYIAKNTNDIIAIIYSHSNSTIDQLNRDIEVKLQSNSKFYTDQLRTEIELKFNKQLLLQSETIIKQFQFELIQSINSANNQLYSNITQSLININSTQTELLQSFISTLPSIIDNKLTANNIEFQSKLINLLLIQLKEQFVEKSEFNQLNEKHSNLFELFNSFKSKQPETITVPAPPAVIDESAIESRLESNLMKSIKSQLLELIKSNQPEPVTVTVPVPVPTPSSVPTEAKLSSEEYDRIISTIQTKLTAEQNKLLIQFENQLPVLVQSAIDSKPAIPVTVPDVVIPDTEYQRILTSIQSKLTAEQKESIEKFQTQLPKLVQSAIVQPDVIIPEIEYNRLLTSIQSKLTNEQKELLKQFQTQIPELVQTAIDNQPAAPPAVVPEIVIPDTEYNRILASIESKLTSEQKLLLNEFQTKLPELIQSTIDSKAIPTAVPVPVPVPVPAVVDESAIESRLESNLLKLLRSEVIELIKSNIPETNTVSIPITASAPVPVSSEPIEAKLSTAEYDRILSSIESKLTGEQKLLLSKFENQLPELVQSVIDSKPAIIPIPTEVIIPDTEYQRILTSIENKLVTEQKESIEKFQIQLPKLVQSAIVQPDVIIPDSEYNRLLTTIQSKLTNEQKELLKQFQTEIPELVQIAIDARPTVPISVPEPVDLTIPESEYDRILSNIQTKLTGEQKLLLNQFKTELPELVQSLIESKSTSNTVPVPVTIPIPESLIDPEARATIATHSAKILSIANNITALYTELQSTAAVAQRSLTLAESIKPAPEQYNDTILREYINSEIEKLLKLINSQSTAATTDSTDSNKSIQQQLVQLNLIYQSFNQSIQLALSQQSQYSNELQSLKLDQSNAIKSLNQSQQAAIEQLQSKGQTDLKQLQSLIEQHQQEQQQLRTEQQAELESFKSAQQLLQQQLTEQQQQHKPHSIKPIEPIIIDNAAHTRILSLIASALNGERDNNSFITLIRNEIDLALERYSADRTELIDYALRSAGGRVVYASASHRIVIPGNYLLSFIKQCFLPTKKPDEMLIPSESVGSCWPMSGTAGFAVIQLRETIKPTAITLQHISHLIAPDYSTAPKEFSLFGIKDSDMNRVTTLTTAQYLQSPIGELLGSFVYLNATTQIQTFEFNSTVINNNNNSYNFTAFTIHSNYGNNDYTCIYRVRIHGKPTRNINLITNNNNNNNRK